MAVLWILIFCMYANLTIICYRGLFTQTFAIKSNKVHLFHLVVLLTNTCLSITRQVKAQVTGACVAPSCVIAHLITAVSAISTLINIYTLVFVTC